MAITTTTKTTAGDIHIQGADPGRICRDHIGRKRLDTGTGTTIEAGAGTKIEAEAGMMIETGITGRSMTGDRHSMGGISESLVGKETGE